MLVFKTLQGFLINELDREFHQVSLKIWKFLQPAGPAMLKETQLFSRGVTSNPTWCKDGYQPLTYPSVCRDDPR